MGTSSWRIQGAQRDSGDDIQLIVTASDLLQAKERARTLGVLVHAVHQLPTGSQECGARLESDAQQTPTETLLHVYSTRPRDHLYIGWVLGSRRHLGITSHRVILYEKGFGWSRAQTIAARHIEGVFVGRVIRWKLVLLAICLALATATVLLSQNNASAEVVLATIVLPLLLAILLFSRVMFLGAVGQRATLGVMRYWVAPDLQVRFVQDIHSIVQDGTQVSMLNRVAGRISQESGSSCSACGYPLIGIESTPNCPECGAAV